MSLREQLRARQLPTAVVSIPADPVGHAAAEREVEAATRALQLVQVRGDADVDAHRARVDAAEAALDTSPVVTFTMRCLPVTDWEALVEAHPASDEQRKAGWQWDPAAFRPALLAAAVVVPDGEQGLTVRDWQLLADEGQVAVGEMDLLFGTAVQLNTRSPQVSTGKGSRQTHS